MCKQLSRLIMQWRSKNAYGTRYLRLQKKKRKAVKETASARAQI